MARITPTTFRVDMTPEANACNHVQPDPLAHARTEVDSARRHRHTVRSALSGLRYLGMNEVYSALERVIEPFEENALDAFSDYEQAVEQRDQRIERLEDRSLEHAEIVRERDAVLADAVRDMDRRCRRSRRPLPDWVNAAVLVLGGRFEIGDDGRLIECEVPF